MPAALERQITAANAGKIQCRILAEAANGPTTPEADVILDQRPEIFVIPDVLCNAGGVVVSYFEWVQDLQSFFWGETEVVDKLFRILETAYHASRLPQPQAENPHAHGRAEPRHQTGAGSETDPGIVPVGPDGEASGIGNSGTLELRDSGIPHLSSQLPVPALTYSRPRSNRSSSSSPR